MKIAIVHDWLLLYAGAERCLEQMFELYPDADLFSLVDFLPDGSRGFVKGKRATTSFIQRLPFARKKYRSYLPLMPMAVEQFDFSDYDLVISSSHAVAKGVLTSAGQPHLCYCYTPIRYAWDLQHQYLSEAGLDKGLKGMMARALMHYIRIWDMASSSRPDHYIGISRYIARRIENIYRREAEVIYPPVDTALNELYEDKEDYYFTASRMVPYKKIPLIVKAFASMPGRRLVVIGDGPDFERARARAGANVDMLGYQSSDTLRHYMQRARAFVFAAEEDFGIVPLEAQACGTPVLAYSRGGAAETVVDGVTGLFFHEQSAEAIVDAVERFEQRRHEFVPARIRQNAERFGIERFRSEFKAAVDRIMEGRG